MDKSLADRVLALVASDDYQPLTPRAISRRLKLDPDELVSLKAAIKTLIKQGAVARNTNKTIEAVKGPAHNREATTLVGTFKRNARGFGFVRPLKESGRHADIYIGPDDGLDASSGDEVAVKLVRNQKGRAPSKGPAGRIVRVVERASAQFVGTYFEESDAGFVRVDGTTFHEPLYVGDPGAKGAKPGDKVAIEIVRYPSPGLEGEGVITEVLGPRGQPGVDTLSIIRAYGLADEFDEDVLEDAREQARRFDETVLASRLDLRGTTTVTIDPATARDFDDAISLDRDEQGHWQLSVHIADVSHFVKPGSPLDRTARQRATSVYLPDRVLPMLPEVLSNALASLQEGRVRYTMTAILDFSPEGICTDRRFARTAIEVDHRFTYEDAYAVMKDPRGEHPGIALEVRELLARMLELAMILRARRFNRGALELVMPEVEVDLGDVGEVVGAHLAHDDESHQVIEEFMLAANEAVAGYLDEHKVAFLRRVHPDPDPRKLEQFAEFAGSLGFPIEDPQSRFELQRVLKLSDDKPERYAVHYGLLRSLKQATYTPEPDGHYALASEDYCHFTSPIRRYPDLQVHRQLTALLAGKKPKSDMDELVVLGEHCTRAERKAEAAERELIKVKLLTHLEGRVGEVFHAVIIGVEEFGFFCQLVELPVEGLIHVTSLGADYYYLEAETHTLIGRRSGQRYRLGDRIQVRVARVDIDRRQLDLILATDDYDEAEQHLPVSRTAGRAGSRRKTAGSSGPSAGGKPPAKQARPARTPSTRPKRKSSRGKKKKG